MNNDTTRKTWTIKAPYIYLLFERVYPGLSVKLLQAWTGRKMRPKWIGNLPKIVFQAQIAVWWFILNANRHSDGWTDGRKNLIVEMRGRTTYKTRNKATSMIGSSLGSTMKKSYTPITPVNPRGIGVCIISSNFITAEVLHFCNRHQLL